MNYNEWITVGLDAGWCGPAVCYTHDGLPTSREEDDEFEENDPCIHIIRLYESADAKFKIEENHVPSVWRNLGNS